MESLNIPNIKIKKANAINTYRNLRKIAALFRFFELFLFIMVVSRFTTQLPLAFRISADYFTGISLSLFTPGSVFLIGNAIVLVLLFLSFSAGDKKSSNPPVDDYYDDYVKRNRKISYFHQEMRLTQQHKLQTIKDQAEVIIAPVEIKEQKQYEEKRKKIERSKSDKIIDRPEEKPVGRQLTRTLTETCRKVSSREDEMSNEEFQQKVEDFIASQQRQFFGSVKP